MIRNIIDWTVYFFFALSVTLILSIAGIAETTSVILTPVEEKTTYELVVKLIDYSEKNRVDLMALITKQTDIINTKCKRKGIKSFFVGE